MINIEKEALKYNLSSLINLQNKRRENIILFEQAIKNERSACQQEEIAQASLETKLRHHDLGLIKLTDTDKELIIADLPKLKSTNEKRNQTILLLKSAIIQEYEIMDSEEKMIHFLEKQNAGKI